MSYYEKRVVEDTTVCVLFHVSQIDIQEDRVVEAILFHYDFLILGRPETERHRLYAVKWEGYPLSHVTWENARLTPDAKRAYETQVAAQTRRSSYDLSSEIADFEVEVSRSGGPGGANTHIVTDPPLPSIIVTSILDRGIRRRPTDNVEIPYYKVSTNIPIPPNTTKIESLISVWIPLLFSEDEGFPNTGLHLLAAHPEFNADFHTLYLRCAGADEASQLPGWDEVEEEKKLAVLDWTPEKEEIGGEARQRRRRRQRKRLTADQRDADFVLDEEEEEEEEEVEEEEEEEQEDQEAQELEEEDGFGDGDDEFDSSVVGRRRRKTKRKKKKKKRRVKIRSRNRQQKRGRSRNRHRHSHSHGRSRSRSRSLSMSPNRSQKATSLVVLVGGGSAAVPAAGAPSFRSSPVRDRDRDDDAPQVGVVGRKRRRVGSSRRPIMVRDSSPDDYVGPLIVSKKRKKTRKRKQKDPSDRDRRSEGRGGRGTRSKSRNSITVVDSADEDPDFSVDEVEEEEEEEEPGFRDSKKRSGRGARKRNRRRRRPRKRESEEDDSDSAAAGAFSSSSSDPVVSSSRDRRRRQRKKTTKRTNSRSRKRRSSGGGGSGSSSKRGTSRKRARRRRKSSRTVEEIFSDESSVDESEDPSDFDSDDDDDDRPPPRKVRRVGTGRRKATRRRGRGNGHSRAPKGKATRQTKKRSDFVIRGCGDLTCGFEQRDTIPSKAYQIGDSDYVTMRGPGYTSESVYAFFGARRTGDKRDGDRVTIRCMPRDTAESLPPTKLCPPVTVTKLRSSVPVQSALALSRVLLAQDDWEETIFPSESGLPMDEDLLDVDLDDLEDENDHIEDPELRKAAVEFHQTVVRLGRAIEERQRKRDVMMRDFEDNYLEPLMRFLGDN